MANFTVRDLTRTFAAFLRSLDEVAAAGSIANARDAAIESGWRRSALAALEADKDLTGSIPPDRLDPATVI